MRHRRNPSGFAGIAVLTIGLLVGAGCSSEPPRFEKIGVLEGFYGNPWSHEDRLDMIRFMGRAGFTHYVYAPKDDPYHRSRWREPYPESHIAQFRELISVADSAGITLVFAISPGLNIVYSDSADVAILRTKLLTMRDLGFKEAALFLDDVPEHLRHENDIATFTSLAEAHVHLVNAIRDGLDLMVCPTTYTSAWGDQTYVETLSRGIGADIPLFWTGRDVAPSTIPLRDIRMQRLKLKGPLYIWDNFPVNDFETWRPLLGALKGRSSEMPKMVAGYFANPMESVPLSMIPLRTVATFAKDPLRYDPEKALDEAVRFVMGETWADSVRPYVDLYAYAGWEDHPFTGIYAPGAAIDSARIDSMLAALAPLPGSTDPFVSRWLSDLGPYIRKHQLDWALLRQSPRLRSVIESGQVVRFPGGYWSMSNDADSLSIRIKVVGATSPRDVTIVLSPSVIPGRRWLMPSDLMIRADLTTGRLRTGHLALTEFSSRGISDIRLNRITSFFDTFWMEDSLAQARWKDGLIRVKAPISDTIRVNLSVPGVYQAADPPMLGNPWTYPLWVRRAD